MTETYTELPNWKFEVEEISMNVYSIVGTDNKGHRVMKTGTVVDDLLKECKAEATEIEKPSCM